MSVPGDDYAEAVSGDCARLAALMARVTRLPNAVMLTPDDFGGRAQVFELGCLRACCVRCELPMQVDGRQVLESDWPRGAFVHVIAQLSGTMTLSWLGRSSVTLEPQDWCVISRTGRFWAESSAPAEFVLLVIPAEELLSVVDVPAKLSERRIRSRSGAAHLFLQFLQDLVPEIPRLSASSRVSFSEIIIQALKAALLDTTAAHRSPAARESLYVRACEVIENNLGNAKLSADYLAQRLRCSKRYLHLLFERHNDRYTINGYITFLRLSRCRSELLMQRSRGKSIAAIAHRWGFHDPAYFARLFRREYGTSPRALIARAMLANGGVELDRE